MSELKSKIMGFIYEYLAFLGRFYLAKGRKKKNIEIIGITGSVGKTSCRGIIADVLSQKLKGKKVYSSSKNFNSETGLVFSIFELERFSPNIINLILVLKFLTLKAIFTRPKYDILVLEYGIDKPGDMDHLLKIAKPDTAILTRIGNVHAEYFENIDEIGKEKMKLLFGARKMAYINAEDDYGTLHFDELRVKKSFFYNDKSDKFPNFSDYKIINNKGILKSEMVVNLKDVKIDVTTNQLGKENALYVSLAFDIASKYTRLNLKENIDLEILPGRFSVFPGVNSSMLIDSSYNASPLAMLKVMDNIANIRDQVLPDYKVLLCLGDMRELGNISESEHKSLAPKIMSLADVLVTVGPEMEKYLIPELKISGFDKPFYSFLKSNEAGKEVEKIISSGNEKYIVLFKGSQNTIFMEEALKVCLLNSDDAEKLTRQTSDWLEKKEEFFTQ